MSECKATSCHFPSPVSLLARTVSSFFPSRAMEVRLDRQTDGQMTQLPPQQGREKKNRMSIRTGRTINEIVLG